MKTRSLPAIEAVVAILFTAGNQVAAQGSPSAMLNGPTPRENFGYSVAISGTRSVVGTWGNNAYVFDFASDTPTMPITLTLPGPAITRSVAISGPLVVVGDFNSYTGADNAGSAYVYNMASATPTVPVATLTNPSPAEYDFFGWSVAISGTRMVVGARSDPTGRGDGGSAYVYDLASATPTEPVATLTNPSPVHDDLFGWSVAISDTRVVVGTFRDDTGAPNAGSAYVYDLSSATPSVPVTTLTNPSPATSDWFGWSVAISDTRVVVGAVHDDTGATNAGSVYVYDLASDTPTVPVATLINPNPEPSPPPPSPEPEPVQDFFGGSVAIFSTRVVVGAPSESVWTNGGIAYMYDLASDTPTMPIATLTNPSPGDSDSFGNAVAIDGGRVLVGAPFDDTGATDAGSAYVYDFATTLYVSQTSTNPTPPYATWDTAAHTIQEAVDAATDGDTVLVAEGEYRLTNQVTVTKAIVLRSDTGADRTAITGQGRTRCLWISNSVAVVEGFAIGNGYEGGEGVLAGGVVMFGGTLTNCIVQHTFPQGRLVYCSSGGLVTDCQIGPNRGGTGFDGAGVYLTDSQLRNSVISGMAYMYCGGTRGAGVYAVSSIISGCTITNNGACQAGGGAYLDRSEVDRCIIVGNSAGYSYGYAGLGGGIFATNSVIRNSLIAGNRASNGSGSSGDGTVPGYGGGVYLSGGSLVNCTLTGNQAASAGGSHVESGTVRNSIIYFNSGYYSNANWYHAGGSFEYSCTTPEPSGVGNIVEDPQFVDRNDTNYRLRPTSPCIDAGANEDWMFGARDLDENPRLANGTVDLGAWESTNSHPAIVTHPRSQTVTNGSDVTLSVTANGARPLAYGWRKDGIALSDATNSTLTLFNVSSANAGVYSVVVSNFAGSTMSSNAVLTVISNLVPVVTWIRPTNSTSMLLSATLNNPNPADNRNLAISVAVSGTRVVVGSPGHRANGPSVPMAFVYDLTGATPATPAITLTNPGQFGHFGDSVAMVGTRILVGARGGAYVYELTNAEPTTPAITLASPTPGVWDVFGRVVSMSGTRLVVGASDVAYVYDLASGTPSEPIATLANPKPGVSEWFGHSVAISGTIVAVGAPLDDTGARDTGSVYVYDVASAEPTVPVATLNNPGPDPSDQFGWSLAMSGSQLVVGAARDDLSAGLAYIYDLASLTPDVPVLALTNPSPAQQDQFGWSVAISGSRVAVSATLDDTGATDAGSTYVYDLANSTPTVPIATLVNPSPASGGWFGYSVAIDGATLIAAPANDNTPDDGGPVYVFSPEPAPSFPAGSDIPLTVRATDSDGSVSFVEFFANSTNLGQAVSATDVYEFVWSNAPSGTFQLQAEAVDDAGGRGISDSVQIVVVTDTPPTTNRVLYVSQTSPSPTPPYATWDTAAHTIQEAVDAATDGDTVLVAAGQYRLTNQITIAKGIVLRSDAGRDQTIINGQERVPGLWVSNSLAVVDGFTMWRGEGPDGAGIFLVGGTVQNCKILSCFPWRAGPDGASARVIGGVLSNSIVSDAFLGGRLVHCSDGGLVTDCQIVAGGLGRGRGTGVYLTDSQLGNSVISGMQFHGVHAISSTIFGCTITSNWLQGAAGGGAYLDGCEVDRCVIVGNGAGFPFGYAGRGGGIFATNSVIRNSLIAGNIAAAGDDPVTDTIGGVPGFGGGIYLSGGSVLNCTVAENVAATGASGLPGRGGGIYVESEEDGAGISTVRNSIVYFNSAALGANWYWIDPLLPLRPVIGGGSFDHSCTTPDPSPVGNNVVQDPQFVDQANGNYRLGPASPCIDVGLNQEWMDGAQDLDGNPRIHNGTVDLGAWESTNTPPTIVSLPLVQFAPPQADNGFIRSMIEGLPGQGMIVVESSSDLIEWRPVQTNTITGDTYELVEPIRSDSPRQFFRALVRY